MSDNKKYYYLKLKEGFFDQEEVKVIKGMDKGDTYVCIMLEMYLRSLKRGGELMVTDAIPFNLDTLSSVLSRDKDEVKYAIELFEQFKLVEILDSGSIYMTEIQNFIGQSSSEGDRKRAYRNRIDSNIVGELGQMSDKRPPEIELEREIELDINSENEKMSEGESLFEKFWEAYGRKGNRKRSLSNWKNLSKRQIEEIRLKLGKYIQSTPDKKYRKNAEVYLNPKNEHWNDEVIESEETQGEYNSGY